MTQEQFKKASQYWNNKEQIPVPEKELKKTVEEKDYKVTAID